MPISRETIAVCEALNRVEGAIIPKVELPEGCYDYFAWYRGSFIEGVQAGLAALDQPEIRFLDAGCGIGSNLLIATHLDDRVRAVGLEIVPEYARIASILLGDRGHVIEGDLRNWDFEFSEYDFIFTARPLIDYEEQGVFETRLRTRMRHGAVLFLVGLFHGGEGWRQLHPDWPVFQKG